MNLIYLYVPWVIKESTIPSSSGYRWINKKYQDLTLNISMSRTFIRIDAAIALVERRIKTLQSILQRTDLDNTQRLNTWRDSNQAFLLLKFLTALQSSDVFILPFGIDCNDVVDTYLDWGDSIVSFLCDNGFMKKNTQLFTIWQAMVKKFAAQKAISEQLKAQILTVLTQSTKPPTISGDCINIGRQTTPNDDTQPATGDCDDGEPLNDSKKITQANGQQLTNTYTQQTSETTTKQQPFSITAKAPSRQEYPVSQEYTVSEHAAPDNTEQVLEFLSRSDLDYETLAYNYMYQGDDKKEIISGDEFLTMKGKRAQLPDKHLPGILNDTVNLVTTDCARKEAALCDYNTTLVFLGTSIIALSQVNLCRMMSAFFEDSTIFSEAFSSFDLNLLNHLSRKSQYATCDTALDEQSGLFAA